MGLLVRQMDWHGCGVKWLVSLFSDTLGKLHYLTLLLVLGDNMGLEGDPPKWLLDDKEKSNAISPKKRRWATTRRRVTPPPKNNIFCCCCCCCWTLGC
jgi:hypothetical protein